MKNMENALKQLETERLVLRPFTEEDHPLILRISSDPGTTKYLYFWGRIGSTPEGDARRFMEYALSRGRETPIRAGPSFIDVSGVYFATIHRLTGGEEYAIM